MDKTRITYADVANVRKVQNPAKRPGDGYGDKIPTDYQVRLMGSERWYKVYAICHANSASFYVLVNNARLFIRDLDLYSVTHPWNPPTPTEPVTLRNLMGNFQVRSGASDDYCKGCVVGAVSAMVSCGMSFDFALREARKALPDVCVRQISEKNWPVSWLPVAEASK